MITKIELSEIVSQLLSKSRKKTEVYDCAYIRKLGDFIESKDSSYRVSLNNCSYQTFKSRSPRCITTTDGKIIIKGLKNPMMKALINQYTPNKIVAMKIQDAVLNVSHTTETPKITSIVAKNSNTPISTGTRSSLKSPRKRS